MAKVNHGVRKEPERIQQIGEKRKQATWHHTRSAFKGAEWLWAAFSHMTGADREAAGAV